jgi:protocatechuate 3,4-dioxygenase beta subunit
MKYWASDMEAFEYSALPARVIFGFGALPRVIDELNALGCKRAFVLSDPHHATVGAARLMRALDKLGVHLSTDAVMHTPVDVTTFSPVPAKCAPRAARSLILLSDILGVSMLVDAVDNVAGPGISDSTVLGPFYAGHQSELAQGDSILLREEASEPLVMSGRVTDPEGQPVADALIEVWQTAPNQLYDVQDTNQPQGHLRASFRTDIAGTYRFQTIMPVSYPIPDDGPAGQLLAAMGRHPYRPAHIHFMISAPGYRTLVTHLFFEGDEFLESDTVFGVKPSLVVVPSRKRLSTPSNITSDLPGSCARKIQARRASSRATRGRHSSCQRMTTLGVSPAIMLANEHGEERKAEIDRGAAGASAQESRTTTLA